MGMGNNLAEATEDTIYKIDTVPPPDGEDDAYSAETKVGPLSRAMVKELMDAAESGANTPVTIPPASGMRARPAKVVPRIPPPPRVPELIPLPAPTPTPSPPPASVTQPEPLATFVASVVPREKGRIPIGGAVALVLGGLVATAAGSIWWLFL